MDNGDSRKRAREDEPASQEFKYLVFLNTEESWGMRIWGIRDELTPVQRRFFSQVSRTLEPPYTNSLCVMVLLGLFVRSDFDMDDPLAERDVTPCAEMGETIGSMLDYLDAHAFRAGALEELSGKTLPESPVVVFRASDYYQ